jgi:hypothetical protein
MSLILCAPMSCVQNRFSHLYFDTDWQPGFPDWYVAYLVSTYIVGVAGSTLLITAGAYWQARHAVSRRMHLTYAYITLGQAIVDSLVVWIGLYGAGLPPKLYHSLCVGGVIGLVLAAAYPLYLIRWFSRRPVPPRVAGKI